jgi:hypothetical protein
VHFFRHGYPGPDHNPPVYRKWNEGENTPAFPGANCEEGLKCNCRCFYINHTAITNWGKTKKGNAGKLKRDVLIIVRIYITDIYRCAFFFHVTGFFD